MQHDVLKAIYWLFLVTFHYFTVLFECLLYCLTYGLSVTGCQQNEHPTHRDIPLAFIPLTVSSDSNHLHMSARFQSNFGSRCCSFGTHSPSRTKSCVLCSMALFQKHCKSLHLAFLWVPPECFQQHQHGIEVIHVCAMRFRHKSNCHQLTWSSQQTFHHFCDDDRCNPRLTVTKMRIHLLTTGWSLTLVIHFKPMDLEQTSHRIHPWCWLSSHSQFASLWFQGDPTDSWREVTLALEFSFSSSSESLWLNANCPF